MVSNCQGNSDRTWQLIEASGLHDKRLLQTQYKKPKQLVMEYSDVFAMCDEELGCTSVVQHSF